MQSPVKKCRDEARGRVSRVEQFFADHELIFPANFFPCSDPSDGSINSFHPVPLMRVSLSIGEARVLTSAVFGSSVFLEYHWKCSEIRIVDDLIGPEILM